MFNYFGTVQEKVTTAAAADSTAAVRGFDIYKVFVPAISQEPIEAAVLTLPGFTVEYAPNDTVVIAELEQKVSNGINVFIMGLLQQKLTPEELEKIALRTLSVSSLHVTAGSLSAAVSLRHSEVSDAPELSVNQLLETIARLESRVYALELLSPARAVSAILNETAGGNNT